MTFTKGNPGGPGRPRRSFEVDYLTALSTACPPGAWDEICRRAVTDAQAGDHRARAWLGGYLVGSPEQHAILMEHQTDAIVEVFVAALGDREWALTAEQQLAGRSAIARHLRDESGTAA